jgi:hypothetical protein
LIETRPSIAGERMPHGSPIRFDGRRCFLERDDRRVEGVTKRPSQTFATHHEQGEPLLVQTHGGIKSERDGVGRWLELQNGKIANV